MSLSSVLLVGLASGFAGWAGENALYGPRYSAVLPAKTPFLPVYAAGGATVALLAPEIGGLPWPVRGAVYGGLLTAIEGAAGTAERTEGRASWDYHGSPVDLRHALLWAGLGLALETLIR